MKPELLLVAPLVIAFATGIATFLARRRPRLAGALSVGGAALLLAAALALLAQVVAAGPIATQAANWPAPFGITFVADLLSAIMVATTGVMALVIAVYALAEIPRPLESAGFHTFYQILIGGVCGAFLTGDLFNLYVWFEVNLMASFALLVLGGSREQLDGGIKYVAINLVATAMFLVAVAVLYGLTGTLNMADLHQSVGRVGDVGLLTVVACLFLLGFGIKSAVFPLFFWLPASYHTPPVTVSALFAALLTKVGVYALIRVFTLIFTRDVAFTHTVLLVVAGLTMVTGVLGAVAQMQVRRLLAFHIISQIGYMIMGLALMTPLALAGAIYFMLHNILAKANLFLISGVMRRTAGSFDLGEIGGLWKANPALALLFAVAAFSLAGMPPLSGFWGKLLLIKAGLDAESYAIAAVALTVGLLTLYSMVKIWNEGFWKPHPAGDGGVVTLAAALPGGRVWLLMAPIVVLAGLTVAMGLFAGPVVRVMLTAADQLLNSDAYVAAVFGSGR
ncbi:MAG: Na+/H+ antiporter subunit D [Azospirillum sp.]|nr:Na+/H+ antiporter subunit D [Azospirillum sp.]